MVSRKVLCVLVVALFGCSIAQPAKNTGFWKGTSMDGMVEEMRSGCAEGSDPMSCIKYNIMSLLDSIFKKESFQVTDSVEVTNNGKQSRSGRSTGDFFDEVESYIESHDVTFKLPFVGAKVTVNPRNIDNDELNLNVQFAEEEGKSSGVHPRKSKLKKILFPIVALVLLKALTLIPLALGILGLKAWNALQLSFFSFVVSIALSVFQLCKKIAADNSHPPIAAHGWEAAQYRAKRSAPEGSEAAQDIAYSAYH